MKTNKFIQKQLVIGLPFKSYSREEWHIVVTDSNEELEEGCRFSVRVTGKTQEEVISAAKIFVKSWNILKETNAILTEVIQINQ
jgi:hypothetical protein